MTEAISCGLGPGPVPPPDSQKLKADAGKVPLGLVVDDMPLALAAVARVLEWAIIPKADGGKKGYKRRSWVHVAPQRYREALLRHHVAAGLDPLSKDEESGLHHAAHKACCALFELELLLREEADRGNKE